MIADVPKQVWLCFGHSSLAVIHSARADVLAAAIAVAQHSCGLGLADMAASAEAVVVDAVGEVVAANSDHATAGESVGLGRPVSAAVVEARGFAVQVLGTLMPSQRSERSAAILLEVGGPVGGLAERAHSVAVVGATVLVALLQTRPVEPPGSRRV